MLPDDLRHRLAHLGHRPRVLELPDRRVRRDRGGDVFKLVVAVKVDLPPELLELARQARLDEVDRALVYAGPRLARRRQSVRRDEIAEESSPGRR